MTAKQTLDREFLEMRCRLLDLAASLDRIERRSDAPGIAADPRLDLLRKGAAILASAGERRAEQMQMLFSDPYVPEWRGQFNLGR